MEMRQEFLFSFFKGDFFPQFVNQSKMSSTFHGNALYSVPELQAEHLLPQVREVC